MNRLIPSSGEVQPGSFLNLNVDRYRPGERVLFEARFCEAETGTIAMMDPVNPDIAIMAQEGHRGALRVIVVDVKARIPAGWTAAQEADLCAALRETAMAAPHLYGQHRKRILREHGVR
jgi:hypothetical protein